MEEESNSNNALSKNSELSKRDSINVQEYKTRPFQQPQQLEDSSPQKDSIVDQFEQKMTGNKKGRIKVDQNDKKASQRSSIQSANLQQISKTKKEAILQFKIQQLQKICSTLTSANQKLLDKIQQLQQQNDNFKTRVKVLQNQIQNLNNQQDQRKKDKLNQSIYQKTQSQRQNQSDLLQENGAQSSLFLEQQVVDIQKMIKDYRQELKKSEENNKINKEAYQNNISQLEKQLESAKKKLIETQQINLELEEQLIELQNKNQQLETQIQTIIQSHQNIYYPQQIEDNRKRTQSRSSQYQTPAQQQKRRRYYQSLKYPNQNYNPYYDQDQFSHLNSSVQMELEKLIQKLVKQLEVQRSIKKKMTQEMKRIQKDLLQSQKEIMNKNKKIYHLEMSLLRGEKQTIHGVMPNYNLPSKIGNSQLITVDNQPYDQNTSSVRDKYFNSPKSKIDNISRRHQVGRNNLIQQQKKLQIPVRQAAKSPNSNFSKNYNNISHKNSNIPTSISLRNQNKSIKSVHNASDNYQITNSNNKNTSTKLLQTFTLLQLVNQPTIILSIAQKLHISIKLVGVYEQKIYVNKNYQLLMLEDILITNFNRINLRLIKVKIQVKSKQNGQNQFLSNKKKTPRQIDSQRQEAGGAQKAIWNMGFLLNSLINDVQDQEKDFGKFESQQKIMYEIQNLLENRSLHKQVFQNLKIFMQQALEERMIKSE